MNHSRIFLTCLSAFVFTSHALQQQECKKTYSKLQSNTVRERALAVGEKIRRLSDYSISPTSNCSINSDISEIDSVEVSKENNRSLNYFSVKTPKKASSISENSNTILAHTLFHAKKSVPSLQGFPKEAASFFFVQAAKNNDELTPFLAMRELSINQQDVTGKTALMYVVQHNLKSLAEVLMERGAKAFTIKDSQGKCAYDYADASPELKEIIWKRQQKDRELRNNQILIKMQVMGPVLEALAQPKQKEEKLYAEQEN